MLAGFDRPVFGAGKGGGKGDENAAGPVRGFSPAAEGTEEGAEERRRNCDRIERAWMAWSERPAAGVVIAFFALLASLKCGPILLISMQQPVDPNRSKLRLVSPCDASSCGCSSSAWAD